MIRDREKETPMTLQMVQFFIVTAIKCLREEQGQYVHGYSYATRISSGIIFSALIAKFRTELSPSM